MVAPIKYVLAILQILSTTQIKMWMDYGMSTFVQAFARPYSYINPYPSSEYYPQVYSYERLALYI